MRSGKPNSTDLTSDPFWDDFEPFGGHHDGDLWPGEVFMRVIDGKLFRCLRTALEHRKWVVHYWDIEKKIHLETSKAIFEKLFVLDLKACSTCGRHPVACICEEKTRGELPVH